MGRRGVAIGHDCMYHLMARGNNKAPIVHSERDNAALLAAIDRVCALRRWEVHAYCLMTNHLHLALTTPEPDLPDGMRDILSAYARRHNRAHGRIGHVFSERYRAVPITDDAQLLSTVRYIALNPVRANLVASADRWPWSSYRDFLIGGSPLRSLDLRTTLGALHPRPDIAIAQFRALVEGDRDPGAEPRPSVLTVRQAVGPRATPIAASRVGYSVTEIADALGVSAATVRNRLKAARSVVSTASRTADSAAGEG